jgi:hypothetical protein
LVKFRLIPLVRFRPIPLVRFRLIPLVRFRLIPLVKFRLSPLVKFRLSPLVRFRLVHFLRRGGCLGFLLSERFGFLGLGPGDYSLDDRLLGGRPVPCARGSGREPDRLECADECSELNLAPGNCAVLGERCPLEPLLLHQSDAELHLFGHEALLLLFVSAVVAERADEGTREALAFLLVLVAETFAVVERFVVESDEDGIDSVC